MKISNVESLRASQIAGVGQTPQSSSVSQTTPSATPAASVQLSAHAQALNVATAAVAAAPDTRDSLVASLKAQVDSGTYKVSGADVADQMVRRAQADQLK